MMRTKTVFSLALAGIIMVGAAAPRLDSVFARQGDCGDPATPIHVIQGSGERTPVGNENHTIQGVVVGDFQDANSQLDGFYVQEEDAEADDDPLTSEGIFVANAMPRRMSTRATSCV
jgi:predicted extracellular nuclease